MFVTRPRYEPTTQIMTNKPKEQLTVRVPVQDYGFARKRSSDWLKIKVTHTADFVVIGCVPTRSEKAG